MANYQTLFLCTPDTNHSLTADDLPALFNSVGCNIGNNCYTPGVPKICFTQARDEDLPTRALVEQDFVGCIEIGDGCYIESTQAPAFHNQCVKLTSVKRNDHAPGKIRIGNNVQLQGTAIVCYLQVSIGDNVVLGPMVTIMDCSGHTLSGRGEKNEMAKLKPTPVTIGKNAWIGANAIIMKGVDIGENAIIGAGSVVYKSVPNNCIALGNPATIVKNMNAEQVKASH
jgi:acetyltransferase-like isoleucine patch superfamily enzyme